MNSSIQWTHGITTSTTGLNMAWEAAGDEKDPVILLVAGLGCQLTMWHDEFCRPLIDLGYRVIRFDNRDIGLTDQHPTSMRVDVRKTFIQKKFGKKVPTNYTLDQMADDALGLIDALKLNKPHVVGISMGGMIGQIMAAKGAEKIGKLVTIMSSTNHPRLPGPTFKVFLNMFLRKPKSQKEDDVVEHVERVMTTIGSPAYPPNLEKLRARTRKAYARAYKPAGVIRQTHSVLATGSIEQFTREIKVPTCIIHGVQDPLLKKACSERIHKLVPNSKLHLIDGLGHDLPDELGGRFAQIIDAHLS